MPAPTSITTVTKLNKGTSRTEWGGLNYWGYKTPDGKVRARVFAPDSTGQALFEVKFYDESALQNTYRRRLDWETAYHVCGSYIQVSDTEKGPDAKSMINEVNTLIEIYNDEATKHIGRKIVRTAEYGKQDSYNNNDDRLNPYEVSAIELDFDTNMVMSTKLVTARVGYGSGSKFSAEQVEDFATDSGRAAVREQIAEYRKRVALSIAYLDGLETCLNEGTSVMVPGYQDKSLGLISTGEVGNLIKTLNECVTETAKV